MALSSIQCRSSIFRDHFESHLKKSSRLRCSAAATIKCSTESASASDDDSPQLRCRRSTMVAAFATFLPAAALARAASAAEEERAVVTAPGASDLTAVTDRVFLEFGLCPEGVRADRRLGDKSIMCSDPEALGRVVIGLYGNAAPGTVANFKALVASTALVGSSLSKILPGQYFVAGEQGPRRSGLLQAPEDLPPNPDMLSAAAFRLTHARPGTVSLNLSENEDDEYIRMKRGYRNISFLVTTGPGPASSLDGENIVFGTVLEGMDVVASIGKVPTFQPIGNLRAFNDLGKFIGDDRASKTAAKWGKPLKAVLVTDAGLV